MLRQSEGIVFERRWGGGAVVAPSCTPVSRAGWVEPRGRVSLGGASLHVQDHMGRPHPGNTSRPAPPYYPGKSRLMPGPSLGAQSTWRADLWVVGGAAPTGLCAFWRQSRLERGAQGVDLVGAVDFLTIYISMRLLDSWQRNRKGSEARSERASAEKCFGNMPRMPDQNGHILGCRSLPRCKQRLRIFF